MSMTLIQALIDPPTTYDRILPRLDPAQVATVTGEEDNTFVPTAPPAQSTPVQSGPATGDWGLDPAPAAPASPPAAVPTHRFHNGCSFAPGEPSSPSWLVFALLAVIRLRRQGRGRSLRPRRP